MIKLYLDVGHGGSDSGAIGNGLQEKNLNLQISNKITSLLNGYEGITVKQNRTSDKTLSLKQRTDEANSWGADLFLSIHINAGGGTGFESFIYNKLSDTSATNKNRNIIHDEIMKMIKGVTDRGKKKANFHVLRESKMQAVLTENMFIDNKKDSDQLKNGGFIDNVAIGHVNGIVRVYGLKKKTTTVKPDTNTFYRVVTGSFQDLNNAEARHKELQKKGFDSFIDVFRK